MYGKRRTCEECEFFENVNVSDGKCKKNVVFPSYMFKGRKHYKVHTLGENGCIYFRSVYIHNNDMKPWEDPESLFCDTGFLQNLCKKDIQTGDECRGK